ncbi:MAG: UDP-N-acetylglucosamine 1-carboxyvinyltransferase [Chitinophagales bacterium]|nr:UDP-N-acetylglucosamine 1-carboxyvinyltransferase [Chitinophagales bacterium]HNL06828.1 UDP-N-acetylglucosamine 1-carboxyvinyltransferase [Chitinophagales bacterium]
MNQNAFEVIGGHRLRGDLQPQGAKNEALQIVCAVLLSTEPITIHNVPNIEDVNKLIGILRDMGVKVVALSNNSYRFQADEVNLDFIYSERYTQSAGRLRGSVMLIGALLGRFRKAFLPSPGGDKIGRRRLDTHFLGLQQLGAQFKYNEAENTFSLEADCLQGTHILMEEISVTGTANVILAAVMAEGITTIYNAACEPYVQQLCKMLNRMGAKISGVGSNLLHIEGVSYLGGCEHHVLPDMIEVGSFIGLAALTQSEIRIKNAAVNELGIIPSVFGKLGIQYEIQGDDIFVPEQDHYEIQKFIDGSIMTIYDSPWPGFTPDLLSIVLVVATQAKGSILVHQKMFESRLFFVDKLIDMGAQIILCDPHRAVVIGLDRQYPLRGINMSSPDIRAGVSLLMAALSAKGKSVISGIEQIDRGYERIDERLQALGADIRRI